VGRKTILWQVPRRLPTVPSQAKVNEITMQSNM
jgi:hypothetical protein